MPPLQKRRVYLPVSLLERSWGLFLTSSGHETTVARQTYPAAGHPDKYIYTWEKGRTLDEFALVYVSRGSGCFESSQQPTRQVAAGDMIWLIPGQWHRYRPDPNTGWTEQWITFDGRLVQQWLQDGLLPSACIAVTSSAQTTELLIQLVRTSLHIGKDAHLLGGLCWSVLQSFSQDLQKSRTDSGRQVRRAALFLLNHPATSVPILAQQYGMKYGSFRRQFRDVFGQTPVQYLRGRQCERAKRLLAETGLSLEQIASRLGFSSVFYFMRFFREMTGSPASKWRHIEQSKAAEARTEAGL